MSRLSLFLLGTPRVELDGTAVELPQRKAMALLAYLAVTGTRHTRDHLTALLWPDAEPARAFAYLRNTLWQLNQTPVGDWLSVERDSVGLATGRDLWIDVAYLQLQLSECLAHGHPSTEICVECLPLLTQVAQVYRGDFLAGFHAGEAAEFDEWQFFQSEHLRQAVTQALDRLTLAHTAGSAATAAQGIPYAQQALALDPLSEPAHRRLMLLYARAGQRSSALRQYEQCMRALKEGLNLTPSRETVDLYRSIRAGQLEPPPSPAPPEAQAAPAAAASESIPARPRLPVPDTPFVGREAELGELKRLLSDPACRLITVTGAGGIGKTRLALEAARRMESPPAEGAVPFAQGVYLVPLASISSGTYLPWALASALGMATVHRPSDDVEDTEEPSQHAFDELLDYLRGRSLLLLLDNAEHLLPPAYPDAVLVDLITAILAQAPGAKLLVTSRTRLDLRGESVLALEGLPCPPAGTEPATELSDAVQLFLACARRIRSAFDPDRQELRTICHICGLVGGLPLGIELAAAWVRLLPCAEIAAELEKGLDFLATTMRDVPERHRSLRAAFEHSWALLSDPERSAYRQLSVFPGGFTREAALQVTCIGLPGLADLVDRSLIYRLPAGRYAIPTVLRPYAVEKLAASPEEQDAVAVRFTDCCLAFVARSEPALLGVTPQPGGQPAVLAALDAESENIRQACAWAAARGEVAALRRAALVLYLMHELPARYREGAATLHALVIALDQASASRDPAHQALTGLLKVMEGALLRSAGPRMGGYEAIERGLAQLESLGLRPIQPPQPGMSPQPGLEELALAQVLSVRAGAHPWRSEQIRRLQESLTLFQAPSSSGDARWLIALALLLMGSAQIGESASTAEANLRRALSCFEELGDTWGEAQVRFGLGIVAEEQGDLAQAQAHLRESLEIQRARATDRNSIAVCLNTLGRLARRQGDAASARGCYEQSLAIYKDTGNRWGIAYALGKLGLIAYEGEDYSETRCLLQESLELYTALNSRFRMAEATRLLGDTALAEGDLVRARLHYERSLWISGHNPWTHLGLGRLALATGREVAAQQYFRQALRHIPPRWPTPAPGLEVLAGIAELRLREGKPEIAAEILGFVNAHPLLSHTEQEAAERLQAELERVLPEGPREAAIRQGRVRKLSDFTRDAGPPIRS